jgi:AcrR family transcriptional regulator
MDPPYLRIAADIRRRIAAGELRPGDRLPSIRRLARERGVAIATATKALDTLSRERLIHTVPRSGAVVAAPAGPPPRARPRRPGRDLDRDPDHGQDHHLDQDRIVRAAIMIADTQGFGTLSMRGVASELGVPTMSLYRHVPGKRELAELMVDAVFGEAGLPAVADPGWRTALELGARLQWAVYRRHQWVARVVSITRPHLRPHQLAFAEWQLSALAAHGLDHATMVYAHATMANYVRGTAVNLEPEADAEQDSGLSVEQWFAAQELGTLRTSGTFPTLGEVAGHETAFDLEELFEFGLRRLLDGLAVLIGDPACSPGRDPRSSP